MTAHHQFPLFDGYNWGVNPSFSDSHPAGGLDFSPVYSKLVKLCTPRLAKNWIFLHRDWRGKLLGCSSKIWDCPFSSDEKALHCKTVLCPLCSNGFKWVDQKLICSLPFTPSSYESSSHSGFTCFCPFHMSTCFHMVKNYIFFSMVNSHFFSWFLKLLTHPQMVQSWLWHTAKQRHGLRKSLGCAGELKRSFVFASCKIVI